MQQAASNLPAPTKVLGMAGTVQRAHPSSPATVAAAPELSVLAQACRPLTQHSLESCQVSLHCCFSPTMGGLAHK